jgi:DNA-binding IclR family transcriptional regulator
MRFPLGRSNLQEPAPIGGTLVSEALDRREDSGEHNMAGNRGTPGRSVTSKVAAVLDAFTAAKPELSLNELSSRAGLPLSTTYRLASELVAWGGLERRPGGGYRVGPRLWEVGTVAPQATKLRDIARPFMHDLHEATTEGVSLVVVDGLEAVRLDEIAGSNAFATTAFRQLVHMPLHATAAGKALLAFAPDDLFARIIERGLRRYTERTVVSPAQLSRSLAHIRSTGVAIALEEMTQGSMSVASPVLDARGFAAAALSIAIGPRRSDLRRLALAVRTAALSATREYCARNTPAPAA